ncbi:MAG: lysine exporter LysO family protein [Bacteroidaceae bacterium]
MTELEKEKKVLKPNLLGSVIIVSWFFLGVICSLYQLIPTEQINPQWGFMALCTLILCVGFSVGHDPMLNTYLKGLNFRLFLLPVMTILGTLAGTLVVGLLWHQHSITEYLALGSGFGYYSLSSILITQYKSAELGTIALLANIIREMSALLLAPLIVKSFGRLALISAGGATSMDTTLPIITQYAGKQYIGISVMHGLFCDFSVPFLVTLFCTF